MVARRWLLGLVLVSACNVDSTAMQTGGVSTTQGACPNGAVVVMSDWVSSQVALADLEGNVLSRSVLSSGSAPTDGLSFPLSGDVALPSTWSQTHDVVLLDRYGTNVISWLDPNTAAVTGQLAIGTGFESDPHDYLELGSTRAYIARWGENLAPGQQPYDTGSDILIINPSTSQMTGSIALPHDDQLPPRPDRMTKIGDYVWVSMQRRSLDFSQMGTAELVGIDAKTDAIAFALPLTGLKDCSAPVLSPDKKTAACVCSGEMNSKGTVEDLTESAVITLDVSVSPPKELRRYVASDVFGVALQSDAAYASDSVLLLKTQSTRGGADNNRLLALDLDSAQTTTLLEAHPDPQTGCGRGLTYGGLLCSPGCSSTCLMADADLGVLQRIDVSTPSQPKLLEPITVDAAIGLPPRSLGLF
jgi:hypothetical protein